MYKRNLSTDTLIGFSQSLKNMKSLRIKNSAITKNGFHNGLKNM